MYYHQGSEQLHIIFNTMHAHVLSLLIQVVEQQVSIKGLTTRANQQRSSKPVLTCKAENCHAEFETPHLTNM